MAACEPPAREPCAWLQQFVGESVHHAAASTPLFLCLSALQALLPDLRDAWAEAQPLLMGATANALESSYTSEARPSPAAAALPYVPGLSLCLAACSYISWAWQHALGAAPRAAGIRALSSPLFSTLLWH